MRSVSEIEWDFWIGKRPWLQLQALEALYDGCIHQIDAQIGRIIDHLKRHNEFEDTPVAVTSDHGEGFGEPDPTRPFRCAGHSYGSHDIHYHVPLVVKYPGQDTRYDVRRPATLTQFPSTVASVLEDRWTRDSFVPAGPVVSYATGGDGRDGVPDTTTPKGRLKAEQFAGDIRIVYTMAGDRVRKSVRWGDDESTVEIVDAQNRLKTSATSKDESSIFEEFTRQDIRLDVSRETYDESTEQFLREMGYI